MTISENDIAIAWNAFRSPEPDDRLAGRNSYIKMLQDASNEEICVEGKLSFVHEHTKFFELAKSYFISEDENERRDGAVTLAAIMDVLMYAGESLEERELEDIDLHAEKLFNSEDPQKIADASKIFLAGHDYTNNDRARALSDNPFIYGRAADLFYDSSDEDVQIAVTEVLCMLATGHLENVLITSTVSKAVADLRSCDEEKACRAMHLLNALTDGGNKLAFKIYENSFITRETARFYTRMANRDVDGISARLLSSLAGEETRAAEIAECPGFFEAVINRIGSRLFMEDIIDPDDVHLIQVLAQNGQSEVIAAHPYMVLTLLELFTLTDRNVDDSSSEEELRENWAYGHGEVNFGEPPLCALIENGQAEAVARCPGMIDTAYEMFVSANPLAINFGYTLLEGLDIFGQRDLLVAKYPDICERLEAYGALHAVPPDPIAKNRLAFRPVQGAPEVE